MPNIPPITFPGPFDLNQWHDLPKVLPYYEVLERIKTALLAVFPDCNVLIVRTGRDDDPEFLRADGLQRSHIEIFRHSIKASATYGYNLYVFKEGTVYYPGDKGADSFNCTDKRDEAESIFTFTRRGGAISAFPNFCEALYKRLDPAVAVTAAKRDLLGDHPSAHVLIVPAEKNVRSLSIQDPANSAVILNQLVQVVPLSKFKAKKGDGHAQAFTANTKYGENYYTFFRYDGNPHTLISFNAEKYMKLKIPDALKKAKEDLLHDYPLDCILICHNPRNTPLPNLPQNDIVFKNHMEVHDGMFGSSTGFEVFVARHTSPPNNIVFELLDDSLKYDKEIYTFGGDYDLSGKILTFRPKLDVSIDASRWMSYLSGNELLSELTIPGTHDSYAREETVPPYGELARLVVVAMAACQTDSITAQLENGIRFLDLRCSFRSDGSIGMRHGAIPLIGSLEGVVQDIASFLGSHDQEAVIVSIKWDDGAEPANFGGAISDLITVHKVGQWYTQNAVPRLQACRGKMVLLRRYKGTIGLDVEQWPHNAKGNPIPTNPNIMVQDFYDKPTYQDKWDAIKQFFTVAQALPVSPHLYLNFMTAVGAIPRPIEYASQMNSELHNYLIPFESTKLSSPVRLGVVVFDFPDSFDFGSTHSLVYRLLLLNFPNAKRTP
ncbi:PLC-like phosphodiesterase [Sparassis latifolia]